LRQLAEPSAAWSSAAVGTRGAAPVCAAASATTGAASAAVANNIATVFSFFIESPLEESRWAARNVQIGSEKTWQTPGSTSAHRRSIHCARASSDDPILATDHKDGSLNVALERQGRPNRIAAFPR
jgi:hypothetical protein